MKNKTGNNDLSEPEGLVQSTLRSSPAHQDYQQQRRRDGCPFEVLHFAFISGKFLGRYVVTCQAGYTAGHKTGQNDTVVQALHAAAVTDHGWGYTERDNIGQRIELTTHNRILLSPPCDPSIQNIED